VPLFERLTAQNRNSFLRHGTSGDFGVGSTMENDKPPVVSGLLSLPRFITGSMSRFESDAVLDDGRTRRVAWDRKTRLATVYDENNNLLGWTERGEKGFRQVVLANGTRPPVAIQDKLFSRIIWIDDTKHKSVMMLEGSKRVFGNARLNLQHRDFSSEVRFRCVPELEVAAIIVAFEVYCVANCQGRD
jgi:hypothetical protein